METIRTLYKVGRGPSSSHTMGPAKAAETFKKKYPTAKSFEVTLYSSLAATGKGHLTDRAVIDELAPKPVNIIWKPNDSLKLHPNGMEFAAIMPGGKKTAPWRVYSVGGGNIKDERNFNKTDIAPTYKLTKMTDILNYAGEEGITFWEFVERNEGEEIWDFLGGIWNEMKNCLIRGIREEGSLPGPLKLQRKAYTYLTKAKTSTSYVQKLHFLFAYALGCSEENASGGVVVTAPTCGSCGVLPSVLFFLQNTYDFSDKRILHALATAGLIGNLARTNASISGAEVGCQGEVGVACAMASCAAAQLMGGTPYQVEYAAEMGLEHHLGLTCDPICGLVQIPCIERNAMAAARAIDCCSYAMLSDGRHLISFDDVVETMEMTGRDLNARYRETARGGLATMAAIHKKGKCK